MNKMSNFGNHIYRGVYMKKLKLLIFMILIFPINIFAYSNKIIVGGETIGIEVQSKGIYVVGFYNDKANKLFQVGDIILSIDNNTINSIDDLNNILTESKEYTFTVKRNNKLTNIKLLVEEENNILKTGLYVKDKIYGIGTLSYIDPNTKIFGSLGHEIIESNSYSKFDISTGSIYKAEVSSIKKSINGSTGEKNANVDRNNVNGEIYSNEIEGIFGKYIGNTDNNNLLEVGDISSIKKGKALVKTVISNDKVEDFDIEILSIDESNNTKNILFKITDSRLINKTGGIVQGMSGSPIIQDNKIIGVVNYVIVDDTSKGYGIFITKMLEEGDKIIE